MMPPSPSPPGDGSDDDDHSESGTEVRSYKPGEEKAAADRLGDLFRDPAILTASGLSGLSEMR